METDTTNNLESPAFFNVRDDTQMPDAVTNMASQPDTGLFSANGLFSKLIDTAGDVFALRQQNWNTPAVGSVYPSGQVNPQLVAQDQIAERAPASPTSPQAQLFRWMPYIVGGAFLVVLGAVAFRFARK